MEGLPGLLLAALVGMGAVRQRRRPAIATRHIILADPAASLEECADHVERSGARLLRVLPLIHGVVCECPGPATVSAVSGHAVVAAVEPDWRVPLPRQGFAAHGLRCSGLGSLTPAQRETVPWGVSRIGATAAWTRTRGEGVRVAVVDTGVDTEHPDLAIVLRGGINLLEPDAPPEDDNGHGTHVAGVIAAADNDQGVVGVAPACELYAVKAFDRTGLAATSDVLTALQWCADYGIQVVNMSFGQDEDSPAVTRAVEAAERRGMVLVAAAGNDGGNDTVDFPARLPTVLAVTGADESDRIMRYASRGPEVDLAAPGRGIVSLGRNGGRRLLSGTSMAAPHVTGVVALLLAARPGLSPAEVRRTLMDSAEPLGSLPTEEQGAGLVRADRALEQALGITLAPPAGIAKFPEPESAALD